MGTFLISLSQSVTVSCANHIDCDKEMRNVPIFLACALALFCAVAAAEPGAETQGRAHVRRPAAQRRAAARREAIRLRARHHQGAEEAPHPALVRLHQRETSSSAIPTARWRCRSGSTAGIRSRNHTYTHLDFTKNSVEDFQREILRNEPALELLMAPIRKKVGSKHDWRWFRYPYLHEGDTLEKRRAVRAFLAANGYRIAQTTLDFGGLSLEQRLRALLDAQRRGVHRVAEGKLPHRRARVHALRRSRIRAPSSAATSTT